MTLRRLTPKALEKVWGTPDTEPWYPRVAAKIGEVWFSAPEEPRLLVKFLFTSQKLSVQVHPGDSPDGPGKTEMWHVLRAAPDARLALGFERPVTPDEARAAALTGEIQDLLRWVPVHPGDTFFVPAGTVHAIGEGIVLCEIQQYSDVTYRLYDYGRPRELHLDAALAVAHLGVHPGANVPVDLDSDRRLLVDCPYFRTESIVMNGASKIGPQPRAAFWICVEGDGCLGGQTFTAGNVWVVQSHADVPVEAHGHARWLRTYVPSG